MAELVVDRLEVVHVGQKARVGHVGLLGGAVLAQTALQVRTVVCLGKRVDRGLLQQLVLLGHVHDLAHVPHEPPLGVVDAAAHNALVHVPLPLALVAAEEEHGAKAVHVGVGVVLRAGLGLGLRQHMRVGGIALPVVGMHEALGVERVQAVLHHDLVAPDVRGCPEAGREQVQRVERHIVLVDDVVRQLGDDLVALPLDLGLRQHGIEVERAHVARGHPARSKRVVRCIGSRAVHVDDAPVVTVGDIHERQAAHILVAGRPVARVALRRPRTQVRQHDGA